MIHSAEEFVSLRTSDLQQEYLRAALEPAPIEVWEEIIAQFPEMKIWVIHNKTVPAEILELLSTDPDPGIRAAVAMKNKLPEHVFSLLASDPDYSVRQRIAHNKNTPPELRERLAAEFPVQAPPKAADPDLH